MASWVTAPDGSMVNVDQVSRMQVEQDSSGYFVSIGGGVEISPYYPSQAAAEAAMADMVLGRS